MKKIIATIWLMMLLLLISEGTLAAEDKSRINPSSKSGISIGKCIAKGNMDFMAFLQSSIFSDGLTEGVIEPWKDVLMRNQCQSTDVMSLINQRDKIRKYIRDAFLTCNTQKLPNLKRAYYEVNAEIYYVRHVVDGKVVASLPFNILTTRSLEKEDQLYYPREVLLAEMIKRYDKEIADFEQYFVRLESKYQDRKKTYVKCENDAWKQVAEKWQEFIDNAGGITPAWNKMKKGIGGRAEKIVEAVTNQGLVATLKGIAQVNVNTQPKDADISDIFKNIESYQPTLGTPTKENILSGSAAVSQLYDTELEKRKILSEFEALYKETSDAGVKLLIDELTDFDKTLNDTFTPLRVILDCVNAMNKKQCPGKF
ncbi:MAG: hypothetical protein V1679_01230 [Candidatus Peregrinibacteria bacterium]